MTDQEVFDRVLSGIRRQGGPAFHEKWCRYLTPSGRRCAAGLLMDGYWNQGMLETLAGLADEMREDKNGPFPGKILMECGVAEDQIGLVRELQRAHDHVAMKELSDVMFMEMWEERMRLVALQHDLTFVPA